MTIATEIFTPINDFAPEVKIERQIFSVITIVKNGMIAVRSLTVFLAVHFVAKQEIPDEKRKSGIKMLEKP